MSERQERERVCGRDVGGEGEVWRKKGRERWKGEGRKKGREEVRGMESEGESGEKAYFRGG